MNISNLYLSSCFWFKLCFGWHIGNKVQTNLKNEQKQIWIKLTTWNKVKLPKIWKVKWTCLPTFEEMERICWMKIFQSQGKLSENSFKRTQEGNTINIQSHIFQDCLAGLNQTWVWLMHILFTWWDLPPNPASNECPQQNGTQCIHQFPCVNFSIQSFYSWHRSVSFASSFTYHMVMNGYF